MAIGTFTPYWEFLYRVSRQEFDFLNSTMEVILLDNAYSPDVENHKVLSDVSGQEITDADYTRQTLTNKSITLDSSGRSVFTADDISFGDNVTIKARYCVIGVNTGTSSTSYLMMYIDLNEGGSSNVGTDSDTFKLRVSSTGLHRIVP